MNYRSYRRRINRLQKEIDEIKKQQAERLKRMYALGLAPFRGYYEKLLREKNDLQSV